MAGIDFEAILSALALARVDLIVVGGVAAALEGAPIGTLDVDIVHSREPANIERLLAALQELKAVYRIQPARTPAASHVASPGRQLLMTRFGPLDVLGAIGRGRAYSDLLPHTTEMEIGEGLRVRVLDLETVIATKEEAGGEKDRDMLALLRRALEDRK